MTLRPPESSVEAALAGADLVLASLPNWARDVVARARARGLPVAVDLQDVRDPADPYRADFIASADFLFASAAHLADPVAAAEAWFAAGPASLVVFGMGARGAMLVQRGERRPGRRPRAAAGSTCRSSTRPAPGTAWPPVPRRAPVRRAAVAEALHRGQVLARIVASDLGGAPPSTAPGWTRWPPAERRATLSRHPGGRRPGYPQPQVPTRET